MTKINRKEIIADIVKIDCDPPLTRRAYRTWLKSLKDDELLEYYYLVKEEEIAAPICVPVHNLRAHLLNTEPLKTELLAHR